MPRSGGARVHGRGRGGPAGLISGYWHVLCFILAPGCLYIAPVRTLPVNNPPDIVDPASLENDLVLIADVERVNVIARDLDEDPLFFVWSGVPSDVAIEPEPPQPVDFGGQTLWLSTYEVPRDKRLDGRTIQVNVFDPENRPVVTVTWFVTVEE